MKKVKQKYQPEIALRFCDFTKKPAVAFLAIQCGYGSSLDLYEVQIDLDEDSLIDILHFLNKKLKKHKNKLSNVVIEQSPYGSNPDQKKRIDSI